MFNKGLQERAGEDECRGLPAKKNEKTTSSKIAQREETWPDATTKSCLCEGTVLDRKRHGAREKEKESQRKKERQREEDEEKKSQEKRQRVKNERRKVMNKTGAKRKEKGERKRDKQEPSGKKGSRAKDWNKKRETGKMKTGR